MTEFNVSGSKLYLSLIIDLYNSENYQLLCFGKAWFSASCQYVEENFRKIKDTKNIILHSDQGWQYQMKAYQHPLKEKGIIQSMFRKGNYLDNAVIENFFGTLKSEMYYTKKFKNIDEFKKEIKDYINDRIRLNLKGKSPVQYFHIIILFNFV